MQYHKINSDYYLYLSEEVICLKRNSAQKLTAYLQNIGIWYFCEVTNPVLSNFRWMRMTNYN